MPNLGLTGCTGSASAMQSACLQHCYGISSGCGCAVRLARRCSCSLRAGGSSLAACLGFWLVRNVIGLLCTTSNGLWAAIKFCLLCLDCCSASVPAVPSSVPPVVNSSRECNGASYVLEKLIISTGEKTLQKQHGHPPEQARNSTSSTAPGSACSS
jgi:hypothetical protein